MSGAGRVDDAIGDLLRTLQDPVRAAHLSLERWDEVLRLARQSRLLGTLYHRIAAIPGLTDSLPRAVVGHLIAARNFTDYRRQLLTMELRSLDRALPREVEVVALKGAAYVLQGLAMADGRLPSDVDLMVRREDLDRAEHALTSAGWESETTDEYDQRYYREWSHELPPMRRPGHALEIDLHHTITPVTSRLQPNQDLLSGSTRNIGGERFRVLHPVDQVIHAAVHLFQDSELADRLRDLVDFDGLVREHLRTDDAWAEFLGRTVAHGMERPVWYALRYGREWFGTPIPKSASLPAPSAFHAASVDWIVTRCMPPRLTGRPEPIGRRFARAAGTVRYHWLRMPPALLARHVVQKHVRRVLMPRR